MAGLGDSPGLATALPLFELKPATQGLVAISWD
jgi:hypothetical protein